MEYQSSDFKKLLDKLQQESWQLELIISGFAIYGLFQTFEPLELVSVSAENNGQFLKPFIITILGNCLEILCFSLLVHVFLRGLWIGAIGLRYVSGDINYQKLHYSKLFNDYLEKKVGSFDRYIHRLENLCSTLFALAFLMVFYLISFFIFFFLLMAIVYLLIDNTEFLANLAFLKWTLILSIVVFTLSAVVVFIDFLSIGSLKKNRFISKIYFPIYRVFSLITLSFLYRPLVYNFLDQKYARWVTMLIVPLYLFGDFIFAGLGDIKSNYFVDNPVATSFIMNNENYEDFLKESDVMVQKAIIPSKIINNDYLEVFMPFNSNIEDIVFEKDSTLRPELDLRGFSFKLKDPKEKKDIDHVKLKKYIEAVNQSHFISIDSNEYNSDFISGTNKFETFGFSAVLDISQLRKGRHLLCITAPKITNKGAIMAVNNKKLIGKVEVDFTKPDTLAIIPFWYFPQNMLQDVTDTMKTSTSESTVGPD